MKMKIMHIALQKVFVTIDFSVCCCCCGCFFPTKGNVLEIVSFFFDDSNGLNSIPLAFRFGMFVCSSKNILKITSNQPNAYCHVSGISLQSTQII